MVFVRTRGARRTGGGPGTQSFRFLRMLERKGSLFAGMGVVVTTGWVFEVDCAGETVFVMNSSSNMLIFQYYAMKSARRPLPVRAGSLASCLLSRVKHIGESTVISAYPIIPEQYPDSISVPILKTASLFNLGFDRTLRKDARCLAHRWKEPRLTRSPHTYARTKLLKNVSRACDLHISFLGPTQVPGLVKFPTFPEGAPTHPLLVIDYELLKAGDGVEIDRPWSFGIDNSNGLERLIWLPGSAGELEGILRTLHPPHTSSAQPLVCVLSERKESARVDLSNFQLVKALFTYDDITFPNAAFNRDLVSGDVLKVLEAALTPYRPALMDASASPSRIYSSWYKISSLASNPRKASSAPRSTPSRCWILTLLPSRF